MRGVGVASAFLGVDVAPKTMKFCAGVAVADIAGCLVGVWPITPGSPTPNMERTIMTMMISRIRIRPKAMITGVLSALFLLPRLPLVYAVFLLRGAVVRLCCTSPVAASRCGASLFCCAFTPARLE